MTFGADDRRDILKKSVKQEKVAVMLAQVQDGFARMMFGQKRFLLKTN